MSRQEIRSAEFTADRAWGALDITNMNRTTVRLHWTDHPYQWHVNDGEEVFAVMSARWVCTIESTGRNKWCACRRVIFSLPASAPNT